MTKSFTPRERAARNTLNTFGISLSKTGPYKEFYVVEFFGGPFILKTTKFARVEAFVESITRKRPKATGASAGAI